jgi:hypothetical protein
MLNNIAALYDSGIAPAVGDYESIATTTLSGNSSSFTFSSIPSDYSHLQLRCFLKSGSGDNDILLQFNGDSGANYSYHTLFGTGSAVGADGSASQTFIYLARNFNTASVGAAAIVDILDYKDTNKYKTARILAGFDDSTSHAGYRDVGLFSGNWRNTAAITSITISVAGGYALGQYTSVALYGVK